MDKITEEIAHFVGSWHLATEEARARHDYYKFYAATHQTADRPLHAETQVTIRAPFDLDDFAPSLSYAAPGPAQYWAFSERVPEPALFHEFTPWPSFFQLRTSELQLHTSGMMWRQTGTLPEPHVTPPGSVAVVVAQAAILSDDDRLDLGGHGLVFRPTEQAGESLAQLIGKTLALSPLAHVAPPGSDAAIKSFIDDTAATLRAYEAPTPPTNGDELTVFVAKAAVLDGDFVNGTADAAVPDYAAYRPAVAAPAADDPFAGFTPSFRNGGNAGGTPGPDTPAVVKGTTTAGEGLVAPHSSIDIQAGGNTLVNAVALTNDWLAAKVTAVIGNHVELNAIVQINAYADDDTLTATLGHAGDDAATAAFNIASFRRIDPAADHAASAGSSGGTHDFPNYWAVTKVTGDLMILNWIEQINFMSDRDTAIMSASGNKVQVVAGDNHATNYTSLAELGHYYDLIIVGGSVYDANVITQTNILLDNDTVGAVSGFAAGSGSVSSHGNLLWNEARITNVGAADRFDALPAAYREAADHLAKGSTGAPADVLKDEAFAGSGVVRALYITGDVIDLQFVKQTNVLGDADKVALAMDKVKGDASADWTVSTGHNTLVNSASILDVDGFGPTHVGGQAYSDEILIQANLISHTPQLAPLGGDALVNEAVAFLGDDMLKPDMGSHGGTDLAHHGALPLGTVQADPMHVLAA
ncbi:type I secretion system ATPase [Aureimonas endophytica]|uniref:Type I secretion system ATPase n=1 Tax=Aureimonas endophytica TaxID=2027858 RepID=A0A916ZH66_9HYPH|nr:type I secretion protein [Aureimonas endophytica]GGD95614.1 type I secretion system ATPase [Aureimonas endophytica]